MSFTGPRQDVLVIKLDREIRTKASIQPKISFFKGNVDIQVGDTVRILASGEERSVSEVDFIYGKGNTVHHKEVKLVSLNKWS